MIVKVHDTANRFLGACGPWLERHEVRYQGILSLADALSNIGHMHKPPFHFVHVEDSTEILGCGIYAEPDGLTISDMAANTVDAMFEHLMGKLSTPSRIFGPRKAARRMAKHFSQTFKIPSRVHSEWLLHKLDTLPEYIVTEGQIRVCESADEPLVRAWARQYAEEKPATLDIEEFFAKKLENGHAYFWHNETPRSILTLSGVNRRGVRISSVYTPPHFRRRGFGSSLVAEMSSRLLRSDKSFVTLSTEVGDSVARIYERLGYLVVGEATSIVFNA